MAIEARTAVMAMKLRRLYRRWLKAGRPMR